MGPLMIVFVRRKRARETATARYRDMNDASTSDASDLAAMLSSSILAGDAEDPAASFIRPKDDEVLFRAGHVYTAWPESTAWPGAEDTLSVDSLEGGSAILVESDGTTSSAVSTSSLVISRLVAEKERLQTRVSVLEALAYSAAEDLRASTTELPGRRAEQIQAMWRRALAVKQLRRTRMAARHVQAWLRGRSARVAARRQGGAATVIQLAARWRQGARRCAACMIQSAVRRFHQSLARRTKGALLRELLALRCEAIGLRQALDRAWGGVSGGGLGGGTGSLAPAAASQAQAGAQAREMGRRLAAAAATPAAGVQAEEKARAAAAVATAAGAAAAAAAARKAADARDWAQVESQAEAEAAEARDEAPLRSALRQACQLRVDNERLQREKVEAEECASRLCAEGLLLRGRLEMLAAATATAEETASFCVAARLQAEFDNEDNGGTTSVRSCRRRAQ